MVPCVRSAAGEDACGAPRDDWTGTEVAAATFADARLLRRFAGLLRQFAAGVGTTIPQACGDWAGAKAAYRFLYNGRVGEADILGGHLAATAERFRASRGVVLILQDTTEFTYRRVSTTAIGVTKSVNSGRDAEGRWRHHTLCGLLLHTSLAVTGDGVPLGVTAVKVWTRSKFRGTAALKRAVNPTRVPIEGKESIRWLDSLRGSVDLLGDPGGWPCWRTPTSPRCARPPSGGKDEHDLAVEPLPLTVPEVRRLLWRLVRNRPPNSTAAICWSIWRRRHQQRARRCHWHKRAGQHETRL